VTPEQYQRVGELYHAALELEPDTRSAYLDEACGGDGELRREIDSLLRAGDQANDYFAAPAMEVAAGLIDAGTMPSLVGRSLNHYQVLSLLGAGGMGEVYLAEDTRLGRKVAIKLLPVEFTRDADRVRRFEKEARAASALNHPNLITIHEIGQVDTTHYIITEYVAGETLRRQMTEGRLGISAALDVATQVASALAAAHAVGIIHRDIKPENVMVRPDGLVKVLDFGLAKLTEFPLSVKDENAPRPEVSTETGMVMGTPSYMSPEQARGLKVDARSDLFSLGVVLYEMIAGRTPFAGATPTDVIISIVQQEPAPLSQYAPEVPRELEQIVVKALGKDREQRYQTANEMLADLKGLRQQLEFESLSGRTGDAAAAVTRANGSFIGRRAWLWALAAAVIVLLTAGGFWLSRQSPITVAPSETPVIAVLPFKNLGAEKESDYFADGLTDELIRNLSIIEGLEVRSRTSSFAFKDKPYNLREVGEKLKVNYVLDGSVLRAGGNLRINAQFIRVSDDKPLWTGKFDSEPKDVFKIQDEISLGITNQLRVNLGRGRRRYETSVEAYDLYLRAGSESNLPNRAGPRMDKQISLYEEVIAKDQSFAPAYAKIALLYAERSIQFPLEDTGEAIAKLRVTADKAIKMDPLLEEAHIALGVMHARDGRWEAAENSFREAIRLNPNRSDTYISYSDWILDPTGRTLDAIDQLRRAETLDPLSDSVKHNLAETLMAVGRFDEAAVYIRGEPGDSKINPGLSIRSARLQLGRGRIDEAIKLLENFSNLANNPLVRGWLGNAYVRSGRREEAEKMAAASQFPNEQALIYAGLGDKDRTFEALERMGSRGPQRVGRFLTYPEFAFLKDDPRLAALRRKVGLPLENSGKR
jgi:serine/threonine-protein kinase